MKIECPNCQLTGQTSDLNIPPEGRYMDCPRCKKNFFVKKIAVANWADTMADCPECGYSSFNAERFDVCPQCGLVAKNRNEQQKKQQPPRKADLQAEEPAVIDPAMMRQELERLEREQQKKRQLRLESVGVSLPPATESVPETVATPAAVKYLGWAFVLLALALLAYGGKGLYDYVKITPAQAVTSPYEEPPGAFRLYLTHGLFPIMLVFLGVFYLVAASQFLSMRSWARKAMEAASWLGVICVVCRELVSLYASVARASGDATFGYYAVELTGFILMVVFWTAPLLAAIWCLRKDFITDEFGE